MAEIDEEKLEKALINSSLMNFYYDFFRESEANKPQNMRQNPITKKELAHKWAGHVAEAYRDLYAVERSISPMDEESVEEGLAKVALRVEPPKIEGGSEARRNWLDLIMSMTMFVMREKLDPDAFKDALLGKEE